VYLDQSAVNACHLAQIPVTCVLFLVPLMVNFV